MVSENEVPGMEVFQVYTQDNDDSDDHTYTMTSDPGDGMQYFNINSSSKFNFSKCIRSFVRKHSLILLLVGMPT